MSTQRDRDTILMIKGVICELPPAEQEACNELAEHIRWVVKQAGDPIGGIALALVGAEMQAAL